MSKKLFAITLLAGSAFVGTANAADGEVKFTGRVIATGCTIAASTVDVGLGSVTSDAFAASSDTAGPTAFQVVLSACPAATTSAALKFDGPADDNNPSLLKVEGAAPIATGVGVGLYEEDSTTPIPVGGESKRKPLTGHHPGQPSGSLPNTSRLIPL